MCWSAGRRIRWPAAALSRRDCSLSTILCSPVGACRDGRFLTACWRAGASSQKRASRPAVSPRSLHCCVAATGSVCFLVGRLTALRPGICAVSRLKVLPYNPRFVGLTMRHNWLPTPFQQEFLQLIQHSASSWSAPTTAAGDSRAQAGTSAGARVADGRAAIACPWRRTPRRPARRLAASGSRPSGFSRFEPGCPGSVRHPRAKPPTAGSSLLQ